MLCTCAVAQQNAPVAIPPTHQHAVVDSPRIDGKDHPEQIPDHLAYGLYLAAISSPTEAGKASQAIHLRMMNLSDQDSQAAVAILASFRERRQQLIKDYNAKATEANQQGRPVDPAVRQAFFADLNSMVMTTHDDLKSTLSPQGWEAFDGRVQNQKRGMTIPASEGVK